jgi:carboxymethylenebutenolidase
MPVAEIGESVDVPTPDGASLHAELFLADGGGPHPGVVVLHESFGLNDDIRRIARRFAQAGYAALAPDLYSHGTRIVCLSRVMIDMLSGSVAREIGDIHATREALAARAEVDARAHRRGRLLPGRGLRARRGHEAGLLGGRRQLRRRPL